MELDEITEQIIGCVYEVGNTLGSGFVEKVYENSLFHQLIKSGFSVKQQHQMNVFYDNVMVGEFFVDLLVEDRVLLELKAVRQLDDVHTAHVMNYLKASGLPVCLLINFGRPKVEIRRFVPYDIWRQNKPRLTNRNRV